MAVGIENNLSGTITDQTSSTSYGDFRNDFPVAGVDQPSDTFRINYKVIQEAIENLQAKSITLNGDVTGAITSPAGAIFDSGSAGITITTSLSGSFVATDGSSIMTGDLQLASPATITTTSDWNLVLIPDGTGRLHLHGLIWPNTDGTADQALTTDGSGNLGWTTVLTEVAEDTTPQLGGDLDTAGNAIVGDPHIDLTVTDPDARVRVSGSGPGPGDGIISAQDAIISNNPGGVLTLRGGTGDGAGDGGNLVLEGGVGGGSGNPGNIQIEFVDDGDYATWPGADGTASQVLTTDGSGNLYWSVGGGGGGGVTSVGSGTGLTGGPITTTGTLSVDIYNLSENVAPTGNHWIMIENPGGGTIEKTQIQYIPGAAGGAGGDLSRALVVRSAADTVLDSTLKVVSWTGEAYDIGNWTGPYPSTIVTVPTDITRVRVYAGVRLQTGASASGIFRLRILKNGSSTFYGAPSSIIDVTQGTTYYSVVAVTPPLNVTPGDEFSVDVYQDSGQTCTIQADNTYLGIEEATPIEKALDDLSDVNVGNPPIALDDGKVLTWDDGAGEFVLSVVAAVAGGANTQVQYNNAGTLTGDTGFTTDGAGNVAILGSFNIDNITINTNTISSSNTDGDIIISPDGTGIVQTTKLLEVPQIRFDDTGSDGTKWVMAENGSNNLVFTYGTDDVLTILNNGNINVTGSVIANDGTTNTDLVLATTGSGLIVTTSGYDMSSGPEYAFATKGYVDTTSSSSLTGLSDTTITTPVDKELLQYNGSQWVNTSPSIDDLGDVDTSTTSPLSGVFLIWDGSANWIPANAVHMEYPADEENFVITNTVDPTLEINFKTRSALGLTQLQSTVNDVTQNAQIGIQRNDGTGDASNSNTSLFLSTITGSRTISIVVRDPDIAFAKVKEILFDADNAEIDFDAMTLTNVSKLSSAGTNTNDDLILEPTGTGLVVAYSGYDMSSGPDYSFVTKDYVDSFVVPSGATGSRPSTPVTGSHFFDTTLGIPIWYDGVNWVDATGGTV